MIKNKPSDKIEQFFQNDFIKICKGGDNLSPPPFFEGNQMYEKIVQLKFLTVDDKYH
jgi:hypothetical protein